MNIQTPQAPSRSRPARFTSRAYVEGRELINNMFHKTELLDGVIFEMAADGPRTTEWNIAINAWLVRSLPSGLDVVPDKTLALGELWAPTPDFYVIPSEIPVSEVRPLDVLLVIEVSDTTLTRDLGQKADAYAAHGVREYWVIDPEARCTFVHRLSGDNAYDVPDRYPVTEMITAQHIPGLSLRLADLPRIKT